MDPVGQYHIVSTLPENGYDTLHQPHFVEYAATPSGFPQNDENFAQMTSQTGGNFDNVLTTSTAAPHAINYFPPTSHAMEYVQSVYQMQFAQEIAQNIAENLPYGSRTIITSDGKRKRRRIITHEQRKAANIRERRRMYHLNEAFDQLRKRVPTFAYEKKLSRIETLKLAVTYIKFMGELVEEIGGETKANLSKDSSDDGLGTSGDSSTLDPDFETEIDNKRSPCSMADSLVEVGSPSTSCEADDQDLQVRDTSDTDELIK